MIRSEEPLPTTIMQGLDEAKGRRVEILPTDGVAWCVALESATQSWTEVGGGCVALESATQSWTEVGGGWSTLVLKELASDCWSQLAPSQGFHPGAGAAC
jgi:hypothetical protein